jgi:hypothetical protein
MTTYNYAKVKKHTNMFTNAEVCDPPVLHAMHDFTDSNLLSTHDMYQQQEMTVAHS